MLLIENKKRIFIFNLACYMKFLIFVNHVK